VKPLTRKQLATVLAALRYYQSALQVLGRPPITVRDIAEEAGAFLDIRQIDVLCERINAGRAS
jgi:hypothetical protein